MSPTCLAQLTAWVLLLALSLSMRLVTCFFTVSSQMESSLPILGRERLFPADSSRSHYSMRHGPAKRFARDPPSSYVLFRIEIGESYHAAD
jgi:hypothetical protein